MKILSPNAKCKRFKIVNKSVKTAAYLLCIVYLMTLAVVLITVYKCGGVSE